MFETNRPPTIRDVARAAGCSVATVSRVLNGKSNASAAARDRVVTAAEALRFRFSETGRALQSSRTRVIGVLVPSLSNPVFAAAIDGAEAVLRRAGYQVLLVCGNYDAAQEAAAVQTLLARRVDGLILTVSDAAASAALDEARAEGLPVVLLFNEAGPGDSSAACDNAAAAGEIARALLASGHRRIALLAGRFTSSDRSRRRYLGLSTALVAAGAPEPVLLEVDYRDEDHSAALAELLDQRPDLTALVCSNDMLAIAVMAGLRSLGLRVPQDLSVVGFDGIAIGTMLAPSLATIAIPNADLGREAARLLLASLGQRHTAIGSNQAGPPRARTLPHQFRPGGSLSRARTDVRCGRYNARSDAHPPTSCHMNLENDP